MKVTYLHKYASGLPHLTFDDGPNPHATSIILELLAEYQIEATFFMLGSRIASYPDIARLVRDSGHGIGNHSHSHSSHEGDFVRCEGTINDVLQVDSDWIRPPFFLFDLLAKEYNSLRHIPIMGGDINSRDYEDISAVDVVEVVQETLEPGSIIVLHDGSEVDDELPYRGQKTIEAVKMLLERFSRYSDQDGRHRSPMRKGVYRTVDVG